MGWEWLLLDNKNFNKPSYYAILTSDVRYSKKINDSEKLLYAELTALSNKFGYAMPSNKYLSKLFDCSSRTISRRISNLADEGFIKVELIYEGKEIKERRIYIVTDEEHRKKLSEIRKLKRNKGIDKSDHTSIDKTGDSPVDKSDRTSMDKVGDSPVDKSGVVDNITSSFNNTSSNNTRSNSLVAKENELYKEIITYLNSKANKRFSPESKTTRRLINGRLSEGYTLEDFKRVIDVKVNEWSGDAWGDKYLRPSTLFSATNFENYLNESNSETINKKHSIQENELSYGSIPKQKMNDQEKAYWERYTREKNRELREEGII